MKKIYFKAVAFAMMAVMLTSGLAGCGKKHKYTPDDSGMAILTYPNFAETPKTGNSWEHIPAGTNHTINWYVDVSSWTSPSGIDQISQKIKEKTGITVKFDTPVTDDGQKLSTMVSGNTLPDVISVPTAKSAQLSMLAQQGYVYDINTLADKWAPSLKNNLPEDVLEWWSYGNKKTYGITNHYYSYEDIPADTQLQPNGGMMIRKDLFLAWQSYVENNLKNPEGMVQYTSLSGANKSVPWRGYITTPEGFKAASIWALENHKGISPGKITTGLQMSQFSSTGSASINWLAQFFAIPFEDANGNYVYQFTTEEYQNMLLYLNDLYRAGVISDANFTHTYDGVGSVIAGGQAFATLVTPQDYQVHFNTSRESGYEYVSMYITNENGDAPVMADIRGYGYLSSMITTSCSRPDLVIKLFDFLTSKEGQRLVTFGVEGITWNWSNGQDSEIVRTEQYLEDKRNQTTAKYGLMNFDILINYQYYDNVQPRTNNGKTEAELFMTNLKRPLSIFAYDYNAMAFVVDATHKDFRNYSNDLNRVMSTLSSQLPKIIKAVSRDASVTAYNTTVKTMKNRGLELIVKMNSEAFAKTKTKLGVTAAWPPRKSGYVNPLDRNQPNGDLTLYRTY